MTEPIEVTPGSRNRLLVIAGAGAAVLVLALVLIRASGGGGSSATTTTFDSRFAVTTTTTTTPSTGDETFQVFNGKDPFRPLRTTGASTGSGTSTGSASASSTASGTSSSTGASGGASGASGATAPRQTARVALLDVFAENGHSAANVRVNDTVYKVTDGQVFATSFKAVTLSSASDCGQFLFGDEPFRLCKGEEALK